MGKIKIKLMPDGSIAMETEEIKGPKCTDYAKVLQRLTDSKIDSMKKTQEYYETENIGLDDIQSLGDND